MADFDFKDALGRHGPVLRRQLMASQIAGVGDDRLFIQEPKALSALAAWVYKSHHATAGDWKKSPDPGRLFGPADTLPGGGVLPAPINGPSGYDGVGFYRPAAKELVLANRGTETEADWLKNAATVLLRATETSRDALKYAMACLAALRASGEPVERVTCTGHSLGGGMAEAQAALLNSALRKDGLEPLEVATVAFASAGFGQAISSLGTTYGGVDQQAVRDSLHFIRPNDPIRATHIAGRPLARIASLDLNVYAVTKKAEANGDRFYFIDGFPFAHSAYLYFYLWDETGPFHYVRGWTKTLRRLNGVETRVHHLGATPRPPYD